MHDTSRAEAVHTFFIVTHECTFCIGGRTEAVYTFWIVTHVAQALNTQATQFVFDAGAAPASMIHNAAVSRDAPHLTPHMAPHPHQHPNTHLALAYNTPVDD